MSIPVTCPECFMDFGVPERFAGKKIKCKSCGGVIPVPKAGASAAADDDPDDFGPAFSPPGLPPRPGQVRQPAAAPAKKTKQGTSIWVWVGGIVGGLALAVLVCCGGPLFLLNRATSNVDVAEYPNLPDFGDPSSPFPVSQIPVPKFPELGPGTAVGDKDVQFYNVDLKSVGGNEGSPGMKMAMRVYLPPGDHVPKSLPCVLVAPAGSTLLMGMPIDDGEYHDETLPYAEAGIAAITYSLDGGMDDLPEEGNPLKASYLRFRAAGAGAVNTRNALEFALAKLPMVDPKKVFAAGHSSGGTASLLAAAHEPRLAGALAYAPAADVEKRMEGAEEIPAMLSGLMFPRLNEFMKQSSPMTHAAAIKCPVFLYHAKADDNTPIADSERFVQKLQGAGVDVTFVASDMQEGEGAEAEADAAGDTPAEGEADAGRDVGRPAGLDLEAAADPESETTADEEMTDEEVTDEEMAAEEEYSDEDYSDEEYSGSDEYGYGIHYESMKKEGLPKGIEWIKTRTGP